MIQKPFFAIYTLPLVFFYYFFCFDFMPFISAGINIAALGIFPERQREKRHHDLQ